MRVKIEIATFPKLSAFIGSKEFEMRIHGSSIHDLLDALISEYGPNIQEMLYAEGGEFDPMIQIIRNGVDWIPSNRHQDPILREGDSLTFAILLAGG